MEDLDAVGNGIKFGFAAFGTVAIGNDDIVDFEVFVESVDGHFGFDFEALGKDGKCFDEFIAEGAVAGHDVADVSMEKGIDAETNYGIAEIVEASLVFGEIGGRKTVADDHVGLTI